MSLTINNESFTIINNGKSFEILKDNAALDRSPTRVYMNGFWWDLEKAIADGYSSLDDLYNTLRNKINVRYTGGGGGGIESVTGDTIDNTDPLNPIVNISFTKTFDEIFGVGGLVATSKLITGAKYTLSDFQTIYDQPDFDINGDAKVSVVTKTSAIEHLVFTATSDSTFDNYVSSVEFPLDKLKFDWNFTQTEYMNAPAKGRISERIDEKNNRCDYDFRTVLYKRYESSTGSGIYSEWKDNGEASAEFLTFNSVAINNDLGAFVSVSILTGQPFILSNFVFQSASAGNKYGTNCQQHTYVDNAFDWSVFNSVQDLTVIGESVYNYIGGNSKAMRFNGYVNNNYFGEDNDNLLFLGECRDNSMWDALVNFTAGTRFNRNIQYGKWSNSTVGDDFADGVIYGITDGITAGDNCFKVDIKSGLNITMGNDISGVAFGGTKNITVGNGMKNTAFSGGIDGGGWTNGILVGVHPELYQPYKKDILLASDGNVYSRYFNGTIDVVTIID